MSLLTLITRRMLLGVLTAFLVSVLLFLATKVLPGDAAQIRLGIEATPENLDALRVQLGLDLPLYQQYLNWLFNFLRGDLGVSLAGGHSVSEMIASRYANTLIVASWSAIIGVPIALTLGIAAAMYPNSILDKVVTQYVVVLTALPEFLFATILVLVLVSGLGVANSIVVGSIEGKSAFELLAHFAMPIATVSILITSQIVRMTRAAILNILSAPYIEMAILKGLPRSRIILRHALPNALGSIVNIVALNLAVLISGIVVIEVFFGYSGLASLMVQGVQARDYLIVQSLGMLFCLVYVTLLLIADIASIVSNPRLRHPA